MSADDLPGRIRDAGAGPIDPVNVDAVWSRAQVRRRRRRIGLGVVSVLVVLLSGAGVVALVGDGESNVETDIAEPDVSEVDAPDSEPDCETILRSFLDPDTDIVVYLEPGTDPESVVATENAIMSMPEVAEVIRVHQGEVYDRFKRAFAGSPEIVSTVTPEILPIQLEVDVAGGDGTEGIRSQELALQLRLEAEQRRLELEMERRGAEPSGSAVIRDVVLRDEVGSGCDGLGREATPDTAILPAPSPFDAPVALPPPVGQPPSEFVAVTIDGRLVAIDTATGAERRQLAAAGDPMMAAAPEEGPGPNVIDGVALSSDGQTVWYSECCEPAGGALYQVPSDGSAAPSRIADGFAPSVSANSRYVAVATNIGGFIVDPIGGFGRIWADDRWQGEYQESAWSLDTTHLVLRTGPPDVGELLVLDPSEFTGAASDLSPYAGPQPRVLDGSNWRLPSFRRDGRFLVAERTEEGWSATLIDPDSGDEATADGVIYGNAQPLAQDYDATGEWLVVVTGDETGVGAARIVGPDGSVTQIPGSFRQVSW